MPANESARIHLPNPALVILIGLQGSGKSTLAYNHFAPAEILSIDEYRARICNDPASQSNSIVARMHLLDVLRQRLRNKVTTVIDSTNLRQDQRTELLSMAAEFGTPAVAVLLTADPTRCRERIDERASLIRNDVLKQSADLLAQTLLQVDSEGYSAVFRLDEKQVNSTRFHHALPMDSDTDRWFEVEQLRPNFWIFRHPADELRRHPAVIAELRPSRAFLARVAADMALGAKSARERLGVEVEVRLPHCLPIHLSARQIGWERTPRHAK